MKRSIHFLIIVFIYQFASFSNAYSKDLPPVFIPKEISGHVGVNFVEGRGHTSVVQSVLSGHNKGTKNNPNVNHFNCSSVNDKHCVDNKAVNFNATIVAPICKEHPDHFCIESMAIINPVGIRHQAKYLRSIEANTVNKDEALNLPFGGATSLWKVEESIGNTTYSITAVIEYQKMEQDKTFSPVMFTVNIVPYEERTIINARKLAIQEVIEPSGFINLHSTGPVPDINCAWQELGKCGVGQYFEDNVSAELIMRVPNKLTGWLHGRLENPEIGITAFNQTTNRLVIKALPVKVPFISPEVSFKKANESIKKLYESNQSVVEGRSVTANIEVSNPQAFTYLKAFTDSVNDKSVNSNSVWNITTIWHDSNPINKNDCLESKDKIIGLVTTNAMIYEGTPPTFNSGFLKYKVGGVHYNSDGTVFQGTYDLIMRSETARCLYKFSSAPISAIVSVISENGSNQIATTTTNESFGWIKLSAKNFSFSAPTLLVKFTQSNKVSVIYCQKGKYNKKVSGVKPSCPKGFKKI